MNLDGLKEAVCYYRSVEWYQNSVLDAKKQQAFSIVGYTLMSDQ